MTNQIISKPQYGKNCKPHFWSLSNRDSWWYTPKTWSFLPRTQWKCVRTLFKTDIGTACDHLPLGHLNLSFKCLKGQFQSDSLPPCPFFAFSSSEPVQNSCTELEQVLQKEHVYFSPCNILFLSNNDPIFSHISVKYRHTLIKNTMSCEI